MPDTRSETYLSVAFSSVPVFSYHWPRWAPRGWKIFVTKELFYKNLNRFHGSFRQKQLGQQQSWIIVSFALSDTRCETYAVVAAKISIALAFVSR